MIIAYAQSASREGVDAAIDGKAVAFDSADFAALREKSVALNVAEPGRRIGDVDVRFGSGLVRLELPGSEANSTLISPIVVVADAESLRRPRTENVARAMDSIRAIGRKADVASLDVGLAEAERLARAGTKRRKVMIAVWTVLVALGVGWLVSAYSTQTWR